MMADGDPEACLNSFECTSEAARWHKAQWAAVLISCLVGPAQQALDTPAHDMADYKRSRMLSFTS